MTDEYLEKIKNLSYQVYITDCLKIIVGAPRRWYENYENIENPQPESDIDETQVKNNLLSKYNGTVTNG